MPPVYLILDGQQRLTSIYQALFGIGQSRFFLDVGGLLSGAEVDESVRVLPADRRCGRRSRSRRRHRFRVVALSANFRPTRGS